MKTLWPSFFSFYRRVCVIFIWFTKVWRRMTSNCTVLAVNSEKLVCIFCQAKKLKKLFFIFFFLKRNRFQNTQIAAYLAVALKASIYSIVKDSKKNFLKRFFIFLCSSIIRLKKTKSKNKTLFDFSFNGQEKVLFKQNGK